MCERKISWPDTVLETPSLGDVKAEFLGEWLIKDGGYTGLLGKKPESYLIGEAAY